MDILIHGTAVITGDGTTVLERAWVGIEGDRIAALEPGEAPAIPAGRVVAGEGKAVFPGVINTHTHGTVFGPLFSSGAQPLDAAKVRANIDRHLSQGTTTLVNLCGFNTMEEAHAAAAQSPLRVLTGTCHLPHAFEAARLVDGLGLAPEHLAATAGDMIDQGAVCVGEVGSGATLGGGVAAYKYVPEAVERETGRRLDRKEAVALIQAAGDSATLDAVLGRLGLKDHVGVERARAIISAIVESPVATALEGFGEAVRVAEDREVPVVFHTATISLARILELSRRPGRAPRVAGHCNHSSFTPAASVAAARRLRAQGVLIDCATLNGIGGKREEVIANSEALIGSGMVDILTTDYGGGSWDGIPAFVQFMSRGDIARAAHLLSLATGRVADAFPGMAPERGYVRPGRIADFVMADRGDLGRIHEVWIGGQTAFRASEAA